ncbi:MAG: hypothetical protein NTV46_00180 [Verrucomicrobia bacterium]|nr:hypothetical protein [Verrucomicrobiota bacterium]
MSTNQEKVAKALNAILADDSDLSLDEIKAELASDGIDVERFLTRFSTTMRKGCQAQIKRYAEQSADAKRSKRTSLFGELAAKGLSELIAIRDKVLNGEYGPGLANAARCRDREEGTEVSASELRSWLEDISTSTEQ